MWRWGRRKHVDGEHVQGDDGHTRREQMVRRQIEARGICNPRVLAAMRAVPRELFVPESLRSSAYDDGPLPIGDQQTISQPYIVALMVEAAEAHGSDRVLEVGAGSGYAAAILSCLAKEVIAIERIPSLIRSAEIALRGLGASNVRLIQGDGTLGCSRYAPYDAIVVSAGGRIVPPALEEQLAIGGRLVIPVGDTQDAQELIRIHRIDDTHFEQTSLASLGPVHFVPLVGHGGWSGVGAPHL
jgi:protein-L-isoaspartate(D-aspartate) O-methyltransferase